MIPDNKPDRPFPSWATVVAEGSISNRNGVDIIEFNLSDLSYIIRGFVQAINFDKASYLKYNPSLIVVDDPRQHWLAHGYFEGRLHVGWERLAFDLKEELIKAPANYFELLVRATESVEARKFSAAESFYKQAIECFEAGRAAKIGLAELYQLLRKPSESQYYLAHIMGTWRLPTRVVELAIDVLSDLGQHDAAARLSMSTQVRQNTAKHVIRLLNRGNLADARRCLVQSSDDLPTITKLQERISREWRERRILVRSLIKLYRADQKNSIKFSIELSRSLGMIGFVKFSERLLDKALNELKVGSELSGAPELILTAVEAFEVTGRIVAALSFLNTLPDTTLQHKGIFDKICDLAYQSGDLAVIKLWHLKLLELRRERNELNVTWLRILTSLKLYEEALAICRQHWISIRINRWLSSSVLQIGRLSGLFLGLSLDECAVDSTRINELPRQIMQFWDQSNPPADVQFAIDSWKEKNPHFLHIMFDNESAIVFLRENFGEKYVELFDRCHHPAMKADFFRLAYLVVVGGVYVDADEYCNQGIERLFDEHRHVDFFASISQDDFFINNRFLIASPQHPYLQKVLRCVVDDLADALQKGQTPDIWNTTGPFQYSRIFAEELLFHFGDKCSYIHRIGLIYTQELSLYLGHVALDYKKTPEGNWRFGS
jgi:hypothetical protein